MVTTRDDLQAALAIHEPDALRLILMAADVDPRGATTSAELGERIADAIWWNHCTPLGYLTERTTLEQVVRHTARRLQVSDRVPEHLPVWEQLESMTAALVPEVEGHGVAASDLDPATQERLRQSWLPALGWGGGAVGSFSARWSAAQVLKLFKGPIGRLLPLLPVVGPWVGTIRWGLGAVHLVSGPLGVALSVVSLNASLGANYRTLVPLLLGVGALGPDPIDDAVVIDEPFPHSLEE
ncbi:MAG: hypothetical protein KTR31_23080 [Myxococcales bacterium]|nr:hypothetical protein [Myxococcales bacterium]